MYICDNCNFKIDDDDFCLKYSRHNAIDKTAAIMDAHEIQKGEEND